MQKSINGATFRKMILGGAGLLEENKELVDSLNVFPVPDGDTGTNMSLTLKNAVNEINNCTNNNVDALCEAFTKGALRGARGNSGVILSQIIKGMCTVLGTETEINAKNFAKALNSGAEVAYKAVTKPKEGTILTVIRMMAEHAMKMCKKINDLDDLMQSVLEKGTEVLAQTPEMLPVLKKAGVVDSGGQGLIIIFTGFYKIVSGDETMQLKYESMVKPAGTPDFSNNFEVNLNDLADIEFAYCTEFMVIEMNKKTTESDIDKLRESLMEIGDSVLCIGDLQLVKVHVHTNQPNKALGLALNLGEIWNIKIENMLEQNRELKKQRAAKEDLKQFGMVSVSVGEGLSEIFKDLSVDHIIEGGQTMNPSADDIAKAVDKVNAKEVFVFPNNKNIVLAAEQAQALTNKIVHVVPTRSVPEGIAAALAFNPDCSTEDNISTMNESLNNVKSFSVTYAVRNTSLNGFDLKEGDIIGLSEKEILAKGDEISKVVEDIINKSVDENIVNISLFYGSDVKAEDAEQLKNKLQEKYSQLEINAIYGGQPVYYYLISIE